MAFAQVGDVELFFTDDRVADASGPPMLFVHGFSCDSHDWSWQLPHFVGRHRVIAVDIRGHGSSSAPDSGYETRQFAADIAGLLEQLNTGPVVAVGHSLGGGIVSALAVEHPALVKGVVSVDPGYLIPEEFRPIVEEMAGSLQSGDPIDGSQRFLSGSYSPASPPALKTWHMRRIAATPGHVLRQTLAGLFVGPESLGFRATSVPYLRRRQCPVLAVYTDPDRAAFEATLFDDPLSKSYAWAGSGHWLHQERPEEFNHLVQGWLATL
ncbi:MAG TPA: alpha/beta hydrolase [Frankiaceae bacterium]|jgi:pimeloyl-ACP methyl ester carboxylesterase|nr:alpha/beta hydrolase [Frankiaceae bacterium]